MSNLVFYACRLPGETNFSILSTSPEAKKQLEESGAEVFTQDERHDDYLKILYPGVSHGRRTGVYIHIREVSNMETDLSKERYSYQRAVIERVTGPYEHDIMWIAVESVRYPFGETLQEESEKFFLNEVSKRSGLKTDISGESMWCSKTSPAGGLPMTFRCTA